MSQPSRPCAAAKGPYWQIVHTNAGYHAVSKGSNHERIAWTEVYPAERDAINAIRVSVQASLPGLDVEVRGDVVVTSMPRVAPEAPGSVVSSAGIFYVDERTVIPVEEQP